MDRRHRVEQVRGHGRARLDPGLRGRIRRIGVTDRRHHPVIDGYADGLQRPRPLRSEGDHPDRPAAGGQHRGQLVAIRIAELTHLVRARTVLRQPRPLEVDAGDDALLGQVGQPGDRGQQVLGRGGDHAGQRRGRAVPAMEVDAVAALSASYAPPPPPCTCRSTNPGTTIWSPRSTSAGRGGAPDPTALTRPPSITSQPSVSTDSPVTTVPAAKIMPLTEVFVAASPASMGSSSHPLFRALGFPPGGSVASGLGSAAAGFRHRLLLGCRRPSGRCSACPAAGRCRPGPPPAADSRGPPGVTPPTRPARRAAARSRTRPRRFRRRWRT